MAPQTLKLISKNFPTDLPYKKIKILSEQSLQALHPYYTTKVHYICLTKPCTLTASRAYAWPAFFQGSSKFTVPRKSGEWSDNSIKETEKKMNNKDYPFYFYFLLLQGATDIFSSFINSTFSIVKQINGVNNFTNILLKFL